MPEQAKRRKRKHQTHSPDTDGFSWIILSSINGCGIGLLISFATACLLCFVAYNNKDPDSLLTPLAFTSLFVPSFFAGLISERKAGSQKLACGLITGALFMLSYMFLSLFFSNAQISPYPFVVSFALHVLIVIFSILGAFAGAHKKRSPSRKTR